MALVLAILIPLNTFGGLSIRIKSIFIHKATKTGNPLVDSVSEHQPSDPSAYWRYLHNTCYIAPVGAGVLLLHACASRRAHADASMFLLLFAGATYTFSLRMSRLLVFMSPTVSALSGVVLGTLFDSGASALYVTQPATTSGMTHTHTHTPPPYTHTHTC